MSDVEKTGIVRDEPTRMGVQRPSALGQKPMPTKLLVEDAEQVNALLKEVRDLLDERREAEALLAEDVAGYLADARALYAGLEQVVTWVRDDQAKDGVDDLPSDVAMAAELLVSLEHLKPESALLPPEDCPECRNEKHANCTQMVPIESTDPSYGNDQWRECPCMEASHRGAMLP